MTDKMTRKKKPRAIILKHDNEIQEHVKTILSKQGWDVVCEQVSKDALETLTRSQKSPFALFISNYKLQEMDGDDILRQVRAISPLTQRMLLLPADKIETLISAIHKAKINACITSPFNDNDLIFQAKTCFKQFINTKKRKRSKSITLHQNKQMLEIAQKLKKKDEKYKKLIEKKKLEISKFNEKIESNKNTNVNLLRILENKGIKPAPDTFKNEFINICKIIKRIFDELTKKHSSDPVNLDLSTILNQEHNETKNIDSVLSDPVEQIIKAALAISTNQTSSTPKSLQGNEAKDSGTQKLSESEAKETSSQEVSNTLNDFFEISFSKNNVKANIKTIKDFGSDFPIPALTDILELLRENHISYGIVEDITIQAWIENSFKENIIIAQGEKPFHGSEGNVKYNFETEFTNPGKINEDGSIDFTHREDIPFVNKDEVMAVKTPAIESKAGIDISGTPIQVTEFVDPVFEAGPGTQISEDGLTITADIGGQPNLDALGTITVNPELAISGDVDFETGNINFKGNIVVNGMIKEGFTVKGVNLTAKEIEGATIDLSGNLNISAGITDSKITTQGNVHAKFINHSNIMAFGNLEVSKEILDSNIILSGTCQNQSGHIISSKITAKMGIEAGKIGTASAKPAKINIGVDKHIETLTDKIQESLKASVSKADLLKDEIKKLEEQDQELYSQVSEQAHIQDRAQLDIKELQKSDKSDTSMEIKKLEKNAELAELELNKIFETQDKIAKNIEALKEQVSFVEGKNRSFVLEQKALKEFSQKEKPKPVINIAKIITQDTMIKGPNSSLILKEDASRCKIQELAMNEDGMKYYEMTISDS